MAKPLINQREPIVKLSEDSQVQPEILITLESNFDMYREIATRDLKLALNFAYLEHLLRISTY